MNAVKPLGTTMARPKRNNLNDLNRELETTMTFENASTARTNETPRTIEPVVDYCTFFRNDSKEFANVSRLIRRYLDQRNIQVVQLRCTDDNAEPWVTYTTGDGSASISGFNEPELNKVFGTFNG